MSRQLRGMTEGGRMSPGEWTETFHALYRQYDCNSLVNLIYFRRLDPENPEETNGHLQTQVTWFWQIDLQKLVSSDKTSRDLRFKLKKKCPSIDLTYQSILSFVLLMTFSPLLTPIKSLSWLSLICRQLLTQLTTTHCWAALNNSLVSLVWPSAGSNNFCQTGISLFLQAVVTRSCPGLIMGCHKDRCYARFSLCCTRNLFHRSYPTTPVRINSFPMTPNHANHVVQNISTRLERSPNLKILHKRLNDRK